MLSPQGSGIAMWMKILLSVSQTYEAGPLGCLKVCGDRMNTEGKKSRVVLCLASKCVGLIIQS